MQVSFTISIPELLRYEFWLSGKKRGGDLKYSVWVSGTQLLVIEQSDPELARFSERIAPLRNVHVSK